MVQTALETLGSDIGFGQELLDLGGQLGRAGGGEGGFVEVIGKAVEVVDQVGWTAAVVEVDF